MTIAATVARRGRTGARLGSIVAAVIAALVQGASATVARPIEIPTTAIARLDGGGPLGRGQGGGRFDGPDVALTTMFDRNGDGRLDEAERRAARDYAENLGLNRSRWGGGAMQPTPGRTITPDEARPYPSTPFYDPTTLRTVFLTFPQPEWERDLMAFKRTDVDVPATLTIDGRTYPEVGVQFHGNSSFFGVPAGLKHSMRIALDFVRDGQDVQSYNTLLLLNAHEDPSYLHTVLALDIARAYIPAPKANLVRVVINGENWGIFINQQQFNKDLVREQFGTTDGTRWKVSGTRNDWGTGLSYLGDNEAPYREVYEIKTKDDPAAWAALVRLTRLLEQTPPGELESALEPILDIDGALKFLAVENVLSNSDGYWSKASDYSLYLDPAGRFHLLPYDVNSTFSLGDSRGSSPYLDPLQAASDPSKPLAARLLASPRLRTRYLGYVRDIAATWLDWDKLGPLATKYHALIDAEVRQETRQLYPYSAFAGSLAALQDFASRRRNFLLTPPAGR